MYALTYIFGRVRVCVSSERTDTHCLHHHLLLAPHTPLHFGIYECTLRLHSLKRGVHSYGSAMVFLRQATSGGLLLGNEHPASHWTHKQFTCIFNLYLCLICISTIAARDLHEPPYFGFKTIQPMQKPSTILDGFQNHTSAFFQILLSGISEIRAHF